MKKTKEISPKHLLFSLFIFCTLVLPESVQANTDKNQKKFEEIALKIWEYAEVGYKELQSSSLLQKSLQDSGFKVKNNLAGMPTAFVAEYGNGYPIIGILGEFDALPGMNQSASPFKEKLNSVNAGHACGHHLFGAGSAWAAVTIKEWLEKNNKQGTIRFYGTPAEEGGSGKVYMTREGLFKDVDIILHWHPGSANQANPSTSNSNKSAVFTFKGVSAHAASAPEKGRSALDGVESMNVMVNFMREHIPQESRIHYVITKGGLAPNVIPDEAAVYYYIRHPKKEMVETLFNRVVKIAEGAALGTETSMNYEVMHGNYSLLPNETLQKLIYKNLKKEGGIYYSNKEKQYAQTIFNTLINPQDVLGDQQTIKDYVFSHGYGSTDVGDVSWNVPTGGLRVATWVPGTSAHSWQAVAAGGSSIGLKGMKLAANVLFETSKELFQNSKIIEQAQDELKEKVGPNFEYYPLLGERDPPLNYRDN